MSMRSSSVMIIPVPDYHLYLSLVVRKPVFGVSDTNQAVQLQKMARCLKCRILEEEELFYLCSADQLHGYCAADLRLCFRRCEKPAFS